MAHDLTAILSALDSAEAGRRLWAAAALEEALKEELESGRTQWGAVANQVLPSLLRCIGDREKGVQVHAANCLGFLSYQSAAVLPALRGVMASEDGLRAWGAALVVARLGLWVPEMERVLAGALGAHDRDLRWAASHFSVQLGRTHPQAVVMAIRTLESPDPTARKMAAYCLGAMGRYAEVEVPLVRSLADPHRDVRRAAVLALNRLPALSAGALSSIAALRSDPDPYVRRTAAAVAARHGA